MKVTGHCFDEVAERMITDPFMFGKELVAVHGLPTGTSGEAGKVGVYPHAWLELKSGGLVYDTVANITVHKDVYYRVGNIEYTVKYEVEELKAMLRDNDTYGPWDDKILDRFDEITEEFGDD